MPGKASTHTAQQERQRHPHQQKVSARGPRQAPETKPPPRARIADTSGNSASGAAAPSLVWPKPRRGNRRSRCAKAHVAWTVPPKRPLRRSAVAPKRRLPATGHRKQALATNTRRGRQTHNTKTPRGPPRRALGTCVVRQTSRRPKHHANVPNIVPRRTEERRYNKTRNFKRPT